VGHEINLAITMSDTKHSRIKKCKRTQKAGGVTEVVKHLPSEYEAEFKP
jgi:hypothetical protein